MKNILMVAGMLACLALMVYTMVTPPPQREPEPPAMPSPMTEDEIRKWEELQRQMPPPVPLGPPLIVEVPEEVRPLPETTPAPNGRVRVLAATQGELTRKKVAMLAVELRVYAEDGTYTVVDDVRFIDAFVGQEFSGVWK